MLVLIAKPLGAHRRSLSAIGHGSRSLGRGASRSRVCADTGHGACGRGQGFSGSGYWGIGHVDKILGHGPSHGVFDKLLLHMF